MNNRIVAIGDIHGRLDCLNEMLKMIDASRIDNEKFDIYFLGDFIDRGPNSAQVLEKIKTGPKNSDRWFPLIGNHEDMMIKSYTSEDDYDKMRWNTNWENNGGLEALRSYEEYPNENQIIKSHVEWLTTLPLCYETDNYLFVHAGFMPGYSLDEQDDESMVWIRDRFLKAENDFAGWKYIVHGHTPQWAGKPQFSEPEILSWRTNLDTAAFHCGILTAGIFDPDNPGPPTKILQTELL